MHEKTELTNRPTKQTIQIENVCESDLLIEMEFNALRSGIELQIEEENPNSDILDCAEWIFRLIV